MADGRRALPEVVGLCPVHLMEFYVPHGGTCPECSEPLAEYVPRRVADALADAADIYAVALEAVADGAAEGPQRGEGHAPSGAGPGSPQTGR